MHSFVCFKGDARHILFSYQRQAAVSPVYTLSKIISLLATGGSLIFTLHTRGIHFLIN